MRIIALLLILVVVAASYSVIYAAKVASPVRTSTAALKKLSWLIGTWEAKMGEQVVFESWTMETARKFRGLGYSLNGKDTVISEKLLIEASDSGLFYISDVAHNPAPVPFKMINQDSSMTLFENPTHDFPTRIIYRQVSPDSLHARIEGIRKGKESGVDYFFKRIK